MVREAAVLVPVYRAQDGALVVVLVRRAQGGAHGGQLALPGGQRDPGDVDLAATALRKAEEVRDFPTWPAPRRIRLWRVGRHEVWGVTYRILEPLVPRLLAGEWPL